MTWANPFELWIYGSSCGLTVCFVMYIFGYTTTAWRRFIKAR